MDELIDRELTLNILNVAIKQFDKNLLQDKLTKNGLLIAKRIVSKQPATEAEPVRHGRWVNDTFCSECNRFPVPAGASVSISDQELTRYFSRCPHCGAIMDIDAGND